MLFLTPPANLTELEHMHHKSLLKKESRKKSNYYCFSNFPIRRDKDNLPLSKPFSVINSAAPIGKDNNVYTYVYVMHVHFAINIVIFGPSSYSSFFAIGTFSDFRISN